MLLKLAWRNLWRSRKRTFITVSSVFFAVLLAVMAESVNRGSHEGMIRNSVSYFTGYLQLQDSAYFDEPSLDYCFSWDAAEEERFMALGGIAHLVSRLQGFVLAAGTERTRGALVLGIDPAQEQHLNGLVDQLVDGAFVPGELVLGDRLAERLKVQVGDSLVLLGQGFQGQQAAGIYRIGGLVKPTSPELRKQIAYLDLPSAQHLFAAEGLVSSVLVMPEDATALDALQERMAAALDPTGFVVVRHWKTLLPELLAAIEFDQASNRIILIILYIVIGFGIFGTVLTMTLERRKEFGVLISVGMRRSRLGLMAVYESLFIGLLGVAAGLLLTYPINYWFYLHPIPLGDELGAMSEEFGVEPMVFFSIDPSIYTSQALVVLGMCLAIALYPAWYIRRLHVLSASRQ